MTTKEFYDLVAAMRAAQRASYLERDPEVKKAQLRKAIELEKAVDEVLRNYNEESYRRGR